MKNTPCGWWGSGENTLHVDDWGSGSHVLTIILQRAAPSDVKKLSGQKRPAGQMGRDAQEQEYLERLRQIRMQNFNERRNLMNKPALGAKVSDFVQVSRSGCKVSNFVQVSRSGCKVGD